jgi:hypothetical protein
MPDPFSYKAIRLSGKILRLIRCYDTDLHEKYIAELLEFDQSPIELNN